jgi:hypothetical protein
MVIAGLLKAKTANAPGRGNRLPEISFKKEILA